MSERPDPPFLERETYRRRRVMDAARILPFFGVFLMLIPVLFAEEAGTSMGLAYLFGAWGLLIAFAALLARYLSVRDTEADPPRDGPEPGD